MNVGTGVGSGNHIALVKIDGRTTPVKFPIMIDGWAINVSTDPWAIKYNQPFEACNDDKCIGYATLEEAIEDISTR